MLGVHLQLEIGRAELPLRIEGHLRQLCFEITFGNSAGCPDDDHIEVARADGERAFYWWTGWIDGPRRHAAGGKLVADGLSPGHRGTVRHERHRCGPIRDMAKGAVIPQERKDILVVVVFRCHRRVRVGMLRGGHQEESDRERDDDARSEGGG